MIEKTQTDNWWFSNPHLTIISPTILLTFPRNHFHQKFSNNRDQLHYHGKVHIIDRLALWETQRRLFSLLLNYKDFPSSSKSPDFWASLKKIILFTSCHQVSSVHALRIWVRITPFSVSLSEILYFHRRFSYFRNWYKTKKVYRISVNLLRSGRDSNPSRPERRDDREYPTLLLIFLMIFCLTFSVFFLLPTLQIYQ